MTGRELIKWIMDNHAEDLLIATVDDDVYVNDVEPVICYNKDVNETYGKECSDLPDEGKCVLL